jgi:hypothetical protein
MTRQAEFKITSINKPPQSDGQWWGDALNGDRKCHWFYMPRSHLHIQEEEPGIPRCFNNIDPPQGARRKIVAAVRSASSQKRKVA